MANTEEQMQDRQKTVIAFVAGLLIGGLLVWVFSSAGGSLNGNKMTDTSMDDTDTMDGETSPAADGSDSMMNDDSDSMSDSPDTTSRKGYIEINDQAAGSSVAINDMTFPTVQGWIVIRDYANGQGGRILGAARYDTSVGLTPDEVTLLRNTEPGGIYLAMFYSEDGDLAFDTSKDTQIGGTATAAFNTN